MRILTFMARRFAWQPYHQTLSQAPAPQPGEVKDAVIAFLQVESGDQADRERCFRHTLKHLKWLANKRDLGTIVLHSFTHLGGINADPTFAHTFLEDMADRLQATGYQTAMTPFGYFCTWQLDVYGESLAKVYKHIDSRP